VFSGTLNPTHLKPYSLKNLNVITICQTLTPLTLFITRHRASTSKYSLTFRIRVATPAQYGRNGTASLQITSHTPNIHVDFIAGACAGPGILPLGSAMHFHNVATATHPLIANPPNSAQLGGIPYHSPKLHPGPCNSVGMRPRTDTQPDTQTRVTTIHFSWSSTHAKCKQPKYSFINFQDISKL